MRYEMKITSLHLYSGILAETTCQLKTTTGLPEEQETTTAAAATPNIALNNPSGTYTAATSLSATTRAATTPIHR
jgi:hypothetical protein